MTGDAEATVEVVDPEVLERRMRRAARRGMYAMAAAVLIVPVAMLGGPAYLLLIPGVIVSGIALHAAVVVRRLSRQRGQ